MKNLSLFALRAAAVLAMTATMVACSDNDPEEPTIPAKAPMIIHRHNQLPSLSLKTPPTIP